MPPVWRARHRHALMVARASIPPILTRVSASTNGMVRIVNQSMNALPIRAKMVVHAMMILIHSIVPVAAVSVDCSVKLKSTNAVRRHASMADCALIV